MLGNFLKIKYYPQNVKSSILLNLIAVLAFQGIFTVFVGIHIKNLGYGETSFGTMLALNSIFIAIGSLCSAFFIRMFTLKKTLIFGFISLAVGFLGLSLSTTLNFILIFSAVIGVGYSIPFSTIAVLLSDNAPPNERIQIFSSNFVIQNVAVVFSTYFAGILIKFLSSFISEQRVIPIIFIITFFIILLGIYPISKLEYSNTKTKKISNNLYIDLKTVLSGKSLEFLKYNTIIGFGAGLVIPFFSMYLKFALNLDNHGVGVVMAFSQIGLVLGGLLVPYVSKTLGKERAVLICQLLSLPFLLSIANVTTFSAVAFSFLMRSTLMNLNQPIIQSLSMECVEDADLKPLLSSLISITTYLTRSISVIVAGYIMEHISYNLPYYITVVFYLVGTYMFWNTFKKIEERN